jgi:hypothetical protein
MYNSWNTLLWQELSPEEKVVIHQCIANNPELFQSANYLEISNAMITLLRQNFSAITPTILQKMPNYNQLWPEIEKIKNTLVR